MSASIVSCCHASPVFELCEHVFDQMAFFIQMPVVRRLEFPVLFRGNTGCDVALCERLPDCITIIASVPDDFFCLTGEICQKHVCASEVTDLSRSQIKSDWSPLIVADSMKF